VLHSRAGLGKCVGYNRQRCLGLHIGVPPSSGGRAVVPDTKTWSPTRTTREYPCLEGQSLRPIELASATCIMRPCLYVGRPIRAAPWRFPGRL
jgi:hypothetical protein